MGMEVERNGENRGKRNDDKMKQGAALKILYLNGNKIDAKACEHLAPALAKMTALETLYLEDNQIDAKACEHLAPVLPKMTALKRLWLSSNPVQFFSVKILRFFY